ncbi:hypothetical protein, partial [Chryseobacterium sp. CH25]|uniref:hypothetical protein n=1 Tax=Chryseobacterium sp. CH25 TaxID=713559 RepID=UPI0010250F4C
IGQNSNKPESDCPVNHVLIRTEYLLEEFINNRYSHIIIGQNSNKPESDCPVNHVLIRTEYLLEEFINNRY